MTRVRTVLLAGTVLAAVALPARGDEQSNLKTAGPPILTGGFADHLQPVEGGKIDWANGYILAEGTGLARDRSDQQKLMAERAAEAIAARNALAIAQGIRIDAAGRFADLREGTVHLEGVIRGHQVVGTAWLPGSRPPQCKVAIRVPLWGVRSLASAVLPIHQAREAERPLPRLALSAQQADVSDFVLVIDARGHKVAPCLFPVVLSQRGQVLYDAATLPADLATRAPAVRYVEARERFEKLRAVLENDDLEEYQLAQFNPQATTGKTTAPAATEPASTQPAEQSPRRAKRRMAVRVAETIGQQKTQLVLTQEDAERLRKSPEAASAMRNAQVLVVVDSTAAGIEGRLPRPLEEFLAAARPTITFHR